MLLAALLVVGVAAYCFLDEVHDDGFVCFVCWFVGWRFVRDLEMELFCIV